MLRPCGRCAPYFGQHVPLLCIGGVAAVLLPEVGQADFRGQPCGFHAQQGNVAVRFVEGVDAWCRQASLLWHLG